MAQGTSNAGNTGGAGDGGRREARFRIGPKKKIGFVCSGGAAKAGAFHLGVALALQEQGFRFYGGAAPLMDDEPRQPGPMEISAYVGSSAGSIIASYLAAGYSLDNIFNSFLSRKPSDPSEAVPKVLPRLTYSKMFKLRPAFAREQLSQLMLTRKMMTQLLSGDWESLLQLSWLKTTGLFSTAGIEQYLREEVLPSNRFQDYLADLFIVTTTLNHSRKVVFGKHVLQAPPHDPSCRYIKDALISEACAASTALPGIFAPYPIKAEHERKTFYIDGEIRDTLSTHIAIDAGADLVIASYTHQPYHYNKDVGSLTEHGLPAILIQSLYLLIEQKINNHIHNKQVQRRAIESVSKWCKENGIPDSKRMGIMQVLEREMDHRMEVDTIYIHPSPRDSEMFFGDHFSLSPKRMTEIVKSGFRAAIRVLRKYDFADRAKGPAIGVTSAGLREVIDEG